MSGPLKVDDVVEDEGSVAPVDRPTVDLIKGREVNVGGRVISRTLPRRARRTVGPWCFLDQMTPATTTTDNPVAIGPHPHAGLQTVTWLTEGEVVHRDSLGVTQTIRPGQLNLMSAGQGVAHAEQSTDTTKGVAGVQLWIAQPDETRFSAPAFEHHEDLPQLDFDNAIATVMVGTLAGVTSPGRCDTPHVGAEITMQVGQTSLPLESLFEYAVLPLIGTVKVGDQVVSPGTLAFLGADRDEVTLESTDAAKVLLIGGEPFVEPLLMWWNFVARTRDEIALAATEWNQRNERFGDVASSLERIDAPDPPWTTRRQG